MMNIVFLYVTFPDIKEAKQMARLLLEARLIACANIFPQTSVYTWEGAVQEGTEYSAFFKTRKDLANEAESLITKNHSYSCPCIATIQADHINQDYLAWIEASTQTPLPR